MIDPKEISYMKGEPMKITTEETRERDTAVRSVTIRAREEATGMNLATRVNAHLNVHLGQAALLPREDQAEVDVITLARVALTDVGKATGSSLFNMNWVKVLRDAVFIERL